MQENERGKILLESGTNEIEIMQFTINNNLYKKKPPKTPRGGAPKHTPPPAAVHIVFMQG